jgi:hypothetical protein
MEMDANEHGRTRLRLPSPTSTSAPSSSSPRAAGPFPATRQALLDGIVYSGCILIPAQEKFGDLSVL